MAKMNERELYASVLLEVRGDAASAAYDVFLKVTPRSEDMDVAFALGRLCEEMRSKGIYVDTEGNNAAITFRASRVGEPR